VNFSPKERKERKEGRKEGRKERRKEGRQALKNNEGNKGFNWKAL
jgi:hypothetical protein